MIRRLRLYDFLSSLRSLWYFKVLGRKRDMVKDRDCKDFEESGVNISRFEKKDEDGNFEIDQQKYKEALMAKNKRLGHLRDCCGDGHYKCYECLNLDYENSDLTRH